MVHVKDVPEMIKEMRSLEAEVSARDLSAMSSTSRRTGAETNFQKTCRSKVSRWQ